MINLERRYSFQDDEAQARLVALTDYWHRNYGLTATWTGSACHVHGKVKGRKYVEGKLEDYLNPPRSLEELRARASG